jgi:hypothetical protein
VPWFDMVWYLKGVWERERGRGGGVFATRGPKRQPTLTKVERAQSSFGDAVEACWARKLGLYAASSLRETPFGRVAPTAMPLFEALEPMLRQVVGRVLLTASTPLPPPCLARLLDPSAS